MVSIPCKFLHRISECRSLGFAIEKRLALYSVSIHSVITTLIQRVKNNSFRRSSMTFATNRHPSKSHSGLWSPGRFLPTDQKDSVGLSQIGLPDISENCPQITDGKLLSCSTWLDSPVDSILNLYLIILLDTFPFLRRFLGVQLDFA